MQAIIAKTIGWASGLHRNQGLSVSLCTDEVVVNLENPTGLNDRVES